MKILIRSAIISHKGSQYHQSTQDVLINQGYIEQIGQRLNTSADRTIDANGMILSVGWFDLGVFVGDPGMEHKEDLDSLALAAARGGFSEVAMLPNTQPCIQSKNAISYVVRRSQGLVQAHPLAAVTMDTQGEALTEMIDLKRAGAAAFTDGLKSIWNADVLLKALQYLQPFDGLLINRPEDPWLTRYGQMNEGLYSVQMGLRGIPQVAEEVAAYRDIELLRYTGGRLHLASLSASGAIDIARKGKKSGLRLSCDIAIYQALVDDSTLEEFDANYKVNPPLRDKANLKALIKGIKDDTIDVLKSGHMPQDVESKAMPFDQAEFGMINLQTFAPQMALLAQSVNVHQLIHKVTTSPRTLLGLEVPTIEAGGQANLTLFDPEEEWVFSPTLNASKSENSPWLNKRVKGRAKAVFNNLLHYIDG